MGYKICNSLVCQKRERYPNFYPHFAATEDDLIDHWISGVPKKNLSSVSLALGFMMGLTIRILRSSAAVLEDLSQK